MFLEFRLKYKITDGNIGDAFTLLNPYVPRLSTTKSLNREKIAKYSLVIVAENDANNCHKSRANVIVSMGDKNDNSPLFSQKPYRASILENTRIGTIFKTVLATDEDAGDNGKITYSITSQTPEVKFSINSHGQVQLIGGLDFEAYDSYTVNLQARDGGGRTGTSTLIVSVQNVNEPPSVKCNVANCRYSVNENVPRGTAFGAKMPGTDPDSPKTPCTLQYALQSSVKSKFAISMTGVISTNGALDREAKPNYGFYVTVRDCGGLTDSVYVTVNVKDLNDNVPRFPGPYSVSVLESERPGSNVVQVVASGECLGGFYRVKTCPGL